MCTIIVQGKMSERAALAPEKHTSLLVDVSIEGAGKGDAQTGFGAPAEVVAARQIEATGFRMRGRRIRLMLCSSTENAEFVSTTVLRV